MSIMRDERGDEGGQNDRCAAIVSKVEGLGKMISLSWCDVLYKEIKLSCRRR